MLLIRTSVGPSAIHGTGVFAAEHVSEGQEVWRYAPEFDQLIPFEELPSLPEAFRAYLDMYAYPSADAPGGLTLSCDHAKFFNHSEDASLASHGTRTLARRAIRVGEEITCNYREFCVGWDGFD
jgi:SET domain-containing protein